MPDWLWLAAIIGGTIVVLFLVLAWIGRDRNTQYMRIGLYFERDRFIEPEPKKVDPTEEITQEIVLPKEQDAKQD